MKTYKFTIDGQPFSLEVKPSFNPCGKGIDYKILDDNEEIIEHVSSADKRKTFIKRKVLAVVGDDEYDLEKLEIYVDPTGRGLYLGRKYGGLHDPEIDNFKLKGEIPERFKKIEPETFA
ncbi:MAG: hypothetical protein J7J92_03065 [Candidatus Aenigmarchaeota archaeon]|nr:hypothetical protein [Candidatus Aenigmarchaeota archaeon]